MAAAGEEKLGKNFEIETCTRIDGRRSNAMRSTNCLLGIVKTASGSARWEAEQTVVVAAVQGPSIVGGRREDRKHAVVEVNFRPTNGTGGPREKQWEQQLCATLSEIIYTTKLPRTCIQITIQVIHDDGSLLAAAFNAATSALLDAAVPMKSMACASAIAVSKDGEFLLDPVAEEELEGEHSCTASFLICRTMEDGPPLQIRIRDMCMCKAMGPCNAFGKAVALCQAGALHVSQLQYQALADSLT